GCFIFRTDYLQFPGSSPDPPLNLRRSSPETGFWPAFSAPDFAVCSALLAHGPVVLPISYPVVLHALRQSFRLLYGHRFAPVPVLPIPARNVHLPLHWT